MKKKLTVVSLALASMAAASAAVTALNEPADAEPILFYACANADGTLQLATLRQGSAPVCKKGSTLTSWNNIGPQGVQGPTGPTGPQGPKGDQGNPGTYVHTWHDANGVSTGVVASTQENGAYVLIRAGGKLLVASFRVPNEGPGRGLGRWVVHDPNTYYIQPDCTGEPYFSPVSSLSWGATAHSASALIDGDVYLLEISEPQQETIRCMMDATGAIFPFMSVNLSAAPAIAAYRLNDLHPEPLTVQ